MNVLNFILFAVGMAGPLMLFRYYHVRSTQARRSAQFLERLGQGDDAEELEALDSKPERLAASKYWQAFLRDFPLVNNTADLLEQAGLKMTVLALYVRMLAALTAVLLVGTVLRVPVLPLLLLAIGGGFVPLALVFRARTKRARAFMLQLPQALELIGLYLRSGRSLPQAFVGATEEILPPAADEFAMCAEEYRLGRPLDAALKKLSIRFPDALGFRLFAIAVSVLGQTGGNLVEVLERIKKTLDAGVTYELRLKAMTGEARTSAWILGSLPGIFMFIMSFLSDSYFENFFNTHPGQVALVIFGILWSCGIMWMRKLMNSQLV